jgi:hypothetical protein
MIFGAPRVAPEKVVFRPTLAMSFLPGISEMQMTKPYFEKLKDPRWQKKRLEVLTAGDWTCVECGDKESTLHVHHRQYFKGREPWEYEVGQLEVLCASCHQSGHENPEDPLLLATSYVPQLGQHDRATVASLVAGFTAQPMDSPHVSDPGVYMAGQIAQLLDQRCYLNVMLDLIQALGKRDVHTVTAAARDFVLDLETRPDAPAPKGNL